MADAEHKSQDEIKLELDEAQKQITLKATYMHYKNRLLYRPLNFATLESDNELCVVYEGQYGYKLLFVRPVKEWLAEVEFEGKKIPRFTKVT